MTTVSPLDKDEVERGTFSCPICGVGEPHSHTDNEVRFRRDQLKPRLTRLAEELPKVGFYSAMHRVYGTEYGTNAERALVCEIQTTLAAMSPVDRLREVLEGLVLACEGLEWSAFTEAGWNRVKAARAALSSPEPVGED